MNKIFKVIWDAASQQFVVTSELGKAKGKTKSIKTAKTALATVVAMTGGVYSAQVLAVQAAATNPSSVLYSSTTTNGVNGLSVSYGIALGNSQTIAIGGDINQPARANASGAIAIGGQSTASCVTSTAIGWNSTASGADSVAYGSSTFANQTNATAIGTQSKATGVNATAVGSQANASTTDATAYGANANATGQASTALGRGANASTQGSISIGTSSAAGGGNHAIAIGDSTKATGLRTTAVGVQANASTDYATALGNNATATVAGAVALGSGSVANRASGTAGYDPKTKLASTAGTTTWSANAAAVSIGNGTATTRQLTSLAAGTNDTDAVNVAQLKALAEVVANNTIRYFSVNSTIAGNRDNTGATGTNAVAIGPDARGQMESSVAIGHNVTTIMTASGGLDSTGGGGVAIGKDSSSYVGGVSVGTNATSGMIPHAVSIGYNTTINTAPYIDPNNTQQKIGGIAIGDNVVSKSQSIAIGVNATSVGKFNVVMGTDTIANGERDIVIGNGAVSQRQDADSYNIAIGRSANATENAAGSVAVGMDTVVNNLSATAVGRSAQANGLNSAAFGYKAAANGTASVAQGELSDATGEHSVAIGSRAEAADESTIAIGTQADALAQNATSIGLNSVANATDSIAMGTQARVADTADSGIAIGRTTYVTGDRGVSIGRSNNVDGDHGIAIGTGTNITTAADYSASVGTRNEISGAGTFVFGSNVTATAANNVILGQNSSESSVTTTNGAPNQVTTGTVGGITYGTFAGTATGIVSVGAQGAERQIINVAPGNISATSTDAINGSQLYAVAKQAAAPLTFTANTNADTDAETLDKTYAAGDGTQQQLGEAIAIIGSKTNKTLAENTDAAVDSTYSSKNIQTVVTNNQVQIQMAENPVFNSVQFGSETGPKITNDGNNIKVGDDNGAPVKITNVANGTNANDAVNLSQLNTTKIAVLAGDNTAVTSATNATTGGTDYIVHADKTVVTPATGSNITVTPTTTTNANGTETTTYSLDLDQATKAQIAKEETVSSGTPALVTVTTNATKNNTGGNDFVVSVTQATYDADVTKDSGAIKAPTTDGVVTGNQLTNIINEGFWTAQVGGTDLKEVNFGDELNFVNGNGTKAVAKDGGVAYDVNLVSTDNTITFAPGTGGAVDIKVNTSNLPKTVVQAGTGPVAVTGTGSAADPYTVSVNTTTVLPSPDQNTNGSVASVTNSNAVMTAGDVINVVKNAGFKLTASANGGAETGSTIDSEVINPGDTVDMAAGKNLVVKQEANGKITYATADDVTFNNVTTSNLTATGNTTVNNFTVAPNSVVNMGGNTITNVANGTNATDAVNLQQLNATKTAVLAGDNTAVTSAPNATTGGTDYTVHADKTVVTPATGSNITVIPTTTTNANGTETTTYSLDLDQATKDQIAKEESVSTGTPDLVTVTTNATKNATGGNDFVVNVTKGTFEATPTTGTDAGKLVAPTTDGVATVSDVVNAINSSGFNVKSGGNKAAGDEADATLINPGEEITYTAGKNLTVKRVGNEFTYATDENVSFNNVTTNNFTVNAGGTVNMGGNTVTNVANGTNATDAVNLQQLNATKTAVLAGDNTAVTSAPNATTGGTDYTVHADKTVVTPVTGSNITVTPTTTTNANGTETTTYSLDLDQATKDQIAKEESVSTGTPDLVTVTTNATKNATGGNDFVVNVTKGTFNNPTSTGELAEGNTGVATVKDVVDAVNKGFLTTKVNGTQVEQVGFGDDINFVDGKGTTARISGQDITYDVNLVSSDNSISITDGANGAKDLTVNTGTSTVGGDGKAITTDTDEVANLGDVVNTINNVSWSVNSVAAGGENTYKVTDTSKISAGDKLNINAGKNIAISGEGDTLNIATAENVTFNNVTASNLTVGPVTINKDGINAGDTKITNVANGTNANDAVNLQQLNATKTAVLAGDNTAVTSAPNATTGGTDYTVHADKTVVTPVTGSNITVTPTTTTNANGTETTTYSLDLDQATKDQIAKEESVSTGTPDLVTVTTNATKNATGGNDFVVNVTKGTFEATPSTGTDAGKLVAPTTDGVATVSDVVNAINSSGFNVKSGGNKAAGDEADATLINPGEEITYTAGKNLTVKRVGNEFTYATDENVSFNNVTTNNFTVNQGGTVNMGGNTVTNVANGTNGTDAVNLDQLNATKTAVLAGDNTAVTSAPNATTGGTDYTVHADKTVVTPATGSNITVTPTTTTNANGTETTTYSLDLDQATKDQIAKEESVSTGTPDLVTVTTNATKNATGGNDFVVNVTKGTFEATPTTGTDAGKLVAPTTDGVATVSDVVNAINASGFNVKSGGNKAAGDEADATLINPGEEITYTAGKNLTVKRVGNEFTYATDENVSFNNVTTNNFTVNQGGTVNMGGNTVTNVANGTNGTDAVNLDQLNASTAANAWKITGNNNAANATTVGNQTVSFNNGEATTAVVDGTNVTYNVNADGKTTQITYTTAGGATVYAVKDPITGQITYNTQQDGKGQTVDAQYVTGSQITAIVPTFNSTVFNSTVNSTTGAPEINIVTGGTEAASNGTATISTGSNATDVATIGDLVETINNVGWYTNSTNAGGNTTGTATDTKITAGKAVNFEAGTNLKVEQKVVDGNVTYTYATSDNVTFNNVTTNNFTVNQGGTVNMGGNTVTNVANGTNGTDAVNLDQLNASTASNQWKITGNNDAANATTVGNQTVSFNNGTGTTAVVDGTNVTYNIDTDGTTVKVGTDGNLTVVTGNTTVNTNGTVGVAAGSNATDVATIGDVTNTINKGFWTTQVNGTAVDQVNFGDAVNFVNGTGTTARADGSNITFDVNLADTNTIGNITNNTNGSVSVPTGEGSKLVNQTTVVNAINNSGFTLKSSATEGTKVSGTDEVINPGEVVDMVAGKNLTVTQEANGRIIYATSENVSFNNVTANNVTVGPVTITNDGINAGNTTITNVAPGTNGTDAVNLDQLNASTASNQWKITGNNNAANATTVGNQTVSFNNGTGTTAVVDGTNVTYNIDTDGTTVKVGTDGNLTVVTGNTTVNTNGTVGVAAGSNATDVATIGDVTNTINKGFWTTQVNGTAVDQVNFGDAVNFVNGTGTTARADGSNITFDVNTDGQTIAVDPTTGNLTVQTTTLSNKPATDDRAGEVVMPADNYKLVTAKTVADAINNSGWSAIASSTGTGTTSGTVSKEFIQPGEVVTFRAGNNLNVDQDQNVFTYSLQENITVNNVTAGNVTVGDVTITEDGIDAGNTTITNVAPGTNGTDAVNLDQLNASTASNQWKITGNNDDANATVVGNQTVSFNNGTGTTAVVNGTNVTYNINTDGTTVKVGTDGNLTVVTGGLTTIDGSVALPTGDTGTSLVNQTTVMNSINQSGWKLAADGTAGTELINPSDTVTFIAGDNLEVVREGANITYKTAENVSFNNVTANNVTVGPVTITNGGINAGNTTITNVKAGTNGTDAVNLDQLNTSTASNQWKITGNNDDANATTVGNQTVSFNNGTGTTAVVDGTNVTYNINTDDTTVKVGTDGNLTVVTGNLTNNPNGTVSVPANEGSSLVNQTTVANAINNSGWQTTLSNGTVDTINPGDTVNYVNGTGTTANVSKVGDVVNVAYDVKVDGTTIKVGDDGNLTVNVDGLPTTQLVDGKNTTVEGKGTEADPYKVNVVTGSTTANSNGTVAISSDSNATDVATIGDITSTINKGFWTTQVNGTEVEQVNFGDAVNFVNGTGTVARADGENITFDVNLKSNDSSVVITNNTDGSLNLAVNTTNLPTTKLVDGNNTVVTGNGTSADPYKVNVEGDLTNITSIANGDTKITLGDQTVDVGGSTISNVKAGEKDDDAVNVSQLNETNQGWTITTSGNTETEGVSSQVKLGKSAKPAEKTVTINGGKNIKVKQEGNTISVATVDTPTFETVTVGGDNGVTMSSTTAKDGVKELSVGTAEAPTRITNVAPGVNDKDAVNVSQLKQVQGNVNAVNKKVDKLDKRVRGIGASSAAASSLPQVYIPGKSMVAAAAGGYGGASAVAVGYSRASDNGKLILKLQGTANSQGHVSGGVGVGYQW